jgi:hypothetical protein
MDKQMGDYVFPEWAVKLLKKPSERTQMESTLIGITTMMLGSLALVSFLIFNQVITGFWYIFLTVVSELGVLSFQFSILSSTYQMYSSYKMSIGAYPTDYKLKLKIDEGKRVVEELNTFINNHALSNTIKMEDKK